MKLDEKNLMKKKNKRVASGCKGSFSHYKNQKYLQLWLFPRFPIIPEKCIIYKSLKHHKKAKNNLSLLPLQNKNVSSKFILWGTG